MTRRSPGKILVPMALAVTLVALLGCEAGPDPVAGQPGVRPAPVRPDVEFIGEDAVVHNGGPDDTTASYQDGEFNDYAPVYSNKVQTLVTGYCLRTAWALPRARFITESRIKAFRSYQVSAHVDAPKVPYILPPEPKPAPPKIVLRKEGDDVVCLGEAICYKIYFKNIGGSDAYNVVVEDVIPRAAELMMETAYVHPFFAETEFIQDENAEIRKIRFVIPGPVPPGHEGYVEFCIRLKERKPIYACLKQGDPERFVGEVANYTLSVRNEGSKAGYNLRMVDQLPAETEFVSASAGGMYDQAKHSVVWTIPKLDMRETATFQLSIRGLAPGMRPNNMRLESKRGIECKAQATTEWVPGSPNLQCRIVGPPAVKPGVPFAIGVEITNTGNGIAHGAVFRLPLPPSISYQGNEGGTIEVPIDTINPGQTISKRFELVATRPEPAGFGGSIKSTEGPGGACRIDIIVAEVVLNIQKTGSTQLFIPQVGDYRIVVGNAGNAPATALVIEDILPQGLKFHSAEQGGTYNEAERRIVWNIGDLAPGGTVEVTYKARGIKTGSWPNQAIATSREQSVRTEHVTVVKSVPGMQISCIDDPDPVEVGQIFTYEVTVLNQSQDLDTEQIQIVFDIDDGLEFIECKTPPGIGHNVQGQTVTFDVIPRMSARQSVKFFVTVRMAVAGDHVSTAKLRWGSFSREVISQEPTTGYE